METKIKKADLVMLKSGGPAMTVMAIENDIITVVWFNQNNEIQSIKWNVELLKLANNEAKQN